MRDDDDHILKPYDRREAISVRIASTIAGKSTRTIQAWCNEHGIGRRVGRGNWQVSRVALSMWLDGDEGALRAYKAGDRSSDRVASYFARAGLKIPQKVQDAQ